MRGEHAEAAKEADRLAEDRQAVLARAEVDSTLIFGSVIVDDIIEPVPGQRVPDIINNEPATPLQKKIYAVNNLTDQTFVDPRATGSTPCRLGLPGSTLGRPQRARRRD